MTADITRKAACCGGQQAGAVRHNGDVEVTCGGCGASWWDSEECLCSCSPGDPNYERREWETTC